MRIALCRIVRIALCCIVFEDTRLPVIVHDIFAKARFVIDLKLMFVGPPLDSRISQCSQCGCSPPYCLTMVAKRPAAGRNEADTVTNRAPGVWWWCHQRPVLTSSFARSEWKSWHIAATRNERCTGHMRSARWKNQHLVFPPKVQGFGHSFLALKWHMSLQLLLKLAVVSLMRSLYVLRVLVVAGPDKHCSSVLDTWRWPQFRFDVDFSHLLLVT